MSKLYNVKCPPEIWYVKSVRDESWHPKDLAFVVMVDKGKAFEKKQQTALHWASRARVDVENKPVGVVIPNIPLTGFSIEDYTSRYSTDNKLMRVRHPKGFVFEISIQNLFELIMTTTIINGEIMSPLVLGFDSGRVYLIEFGSARHIESLDNYSPKKATIKANDLAVGDIFRFKSPTKKGDLYLYLGKHKLQMDFFYKIRGHGGLKEPESDILEESRMTVVDDNARHYFIFLKNIDEVSHCSAECQISNFDVLTVEGHSNFEAEDILFKKAKFHNPLEYVWDKQNRSKFSRNYQYHLNDIGKDNIKSV